MRRLWVLVCGSRWLRPSLADLLLASLIAWLFVAGQGWTVLLADGDTGWHIRTGDWILQNRAIPTRDMFSFSRAGQPWYAWEWLSDVVFALVSRAWGLAGVTALTGCVLALSALVLFGHMLWRGSNALVAMATVFVAVSASSIHYLARPHIFTLLLLPMSLWIVDRDRRMPGPALWLLVPLSAVWVNLHGGFFALPVCLGVLAVTGVIEAWTGRSANPAHWHRLAWLCGATTGASLVNPYGLALHRHIWSYLTSDWIKTAVDEFQAPRFRSENLLHFELLLLAALVLTGWLAARGRIAEGLLVLVWAHLSLGSVRHVPLFAVIVAPMVAGELSELWERWAGSRRARDIGRILWQFGQDLRPGSARLSAWSFVLVTGLILLTPASKWPRDFPDSKFPVSLIQKKASSLSSVQVFTSDQWGDYLIYRHWPRQRVFIDGRSDFYGADLGREYQRLAIGHPDWERIFSKYDFQAVLIPPAWPLAALLNARTDWRLAGQDGLAVLYLRRGAIPQTQGNRSALLNR